MAILVPAIIIASIGVIAYTVYQANERSKFNRPTQSKTATPRPATTATYKPRLTSVSIRPGETKTVRVKVAVSPYRHKHADSSVTLAIVPTRKTTNPVVSKADLARATAAANPGRQRRHPRPKATP